MKRIRIAFIYFTLLTFCSTSMPQHSFAEAAKENVSIKSFLDISPDLALVDEVYYPKNSKNKDKFLIFIQDHHASVQMQRQIAQLIQWYVKEKQIPLVGYEGNRGLIQTDKVFWVPSPELNLEVSEYFLKQLQISGPEYAHINKQKEFDLVGVEDMGLYRKNLKLFQDAFRIRSEAEGILKVLEKEIERSIRSRASDSLIKIFAMMKQYRDNPREMYAYLEFLSKRDPEQVAMLKQIQLLQELDQSQKKWDPLKLVNEMGGFLLQNNINVDSEQLKIEISQPSANTKKAIRNMSDGERSAFPLINSWSNYIEKRDQLDVSELYKELSILEKNVVKRLAQAEGLYPLFEAWFHVEALKSILYLSATRQQVEEFWTQPLSYKQKYFTDTLAPYSKGIETQLKNKNLDSLMRFPNQFYRTALDRDLVMARQIMKYLEDQNRMLFVSGGFHRRGVTQVLRRNKIPYAVLTPQVDTDQKIQDKIYMQRVLNAPWIETGQFGRVQSFRQPTLFNQLPSKARVLVDQVAMRIARQVKRLEVTVPQIQAMLQDDMDRFLNRGFQPVSAQSLGDTTVLDTSLLFPQDLIEDQYDDSPVLLLFKARMGNTPEQTPEYEFATDVDTQITRSMEPGVRQVLNQIQQIKNKLDTINKEIFYGVQIHVMRNSSKSISLREEQKQLILEVDYRLFVNKNILFPAIIEIIMGNHLREVPNLQWVKLYAVFEALKWLANSQPDSDVQAWLLRSLAHDDVQYYRFAQFMTDNWRTFDPNQEREIHFSDLDQQPLLVGIANEIWPKSKEQEAEIQQLNPEAASFDLEQFKILFGDLDQVTEALEHIHSYREIKQVEVTIDNHVANMDDLTKVQLYEIIDRILATEARDREHRLHFVRYLMNFLIVNQRYDLATHIMFLIKDTQDPMDTVIRVYEGMDLGALMGVQLEVHDVASFLSYLHEEGVVFGAERYTVEDIAFSAADAFPELEGVSNDQINEVYETFEAIVYGASLGRNVLEWAIDYNPDLIQQNYDLDDEIDRRVRDFQMVLLGLRNEGGALKEFEKRVDLAARTLKGLINNALDAIEMLGESGSVSISSRLGGGNLRVKVKDTGEGVPQGERERLFVEDIESRKLGYADGSMRGGMGVFLKASRMNLLRLGGDINIFPQSEERGSLFSFSLPLLERSKEQRSEAKSLGLQNQKVKERYQEVVVDINHVSVLPFFLERLILLLEHSKYKRVTFLIRSKQDEGAVKQELKHLGISSRALNRVRFKVNPLLTPQDLEELNHYLEEVQSDLSSKNKKFRKKEKVLDVAMIANYQILFNLDTKQFVTLANDRVARGQQVQWFQATSREEEMGAVWTLFSSAWELLSDKQTNKTTRKDWRTGIYLVNFSYLTESMERWLNQYRQEQIIRIAA